MRDLGNRDAEKVHHKRSPSTRSTAASKNRGLTLCRAKPAGDPSKQLCPRSNSGMSFCYGLSAFDSNTKENVIATDGRAAQRVGHSCGRHCVRPSWAKSKGVKVLCRRISDGSSSLAFIDNYPRKAMASRRRGVRRKPEAAAARRGTRR
jgi:hypothetical protein